MTRRIALFAAALAAAVAIVAPDAGAEQRRDTVVLAMTLEPTKLDPTVNAASAIAEVTL
jgi:peptide/nickel transport system substrate-binding protein